MSAVRSSRLSAAFADCGSSRRLSLIAVPFLFNLLLAIGADWHMAELGAAVTAHANLPFPAQVAIGRALTLWFIGEAILILINLVSVNLLPRSLRTHALFALSGAVAAATPLFANAAQWVAQPFLAIIFSSLCGALAQAGLWAIVYLLTGVALDWLAGRPPRFEVVWEHWRTGFIKGAIYGALFMGLILIAALILSAPGAAAFLERGALLIGPLLGAVLFPLGQTIVGSADGTPPFFGRLRAAYRDPRGPVRGLVVGLGLALAYRANLAAYDGGARFLAMAAIGALCYGGVDLAFDAWSVIRGDRRKLQSWRLYALGVLLGGLVAGALGWYFDTPQLHVVIDKFWAYADVNYRLDGRQLGDLTTCPIFNKYGSINLGEVAGGVRLFWTEFGRGRNQLVARRAALLDQLRSARRRAAAKLATNQDASKPGRRRRPGGAGGARAALGLVDGAGHQLVPAPVAGSHLVQSGRSDPHGRRHRRQRHAESDGLPTIQPGHVHRPSCL